MFILISHITSNVHEIKLQNPNLHINCPLVFIHYFSVINNIEILNLLLRKSVIQSNNPSTSKSCNTLAFTPQSYIPTILDGMELQYSQHNNIRLKILRLKVDISAAFSLTRQMIMMMLSLEVRPKNTL